MVVTDKLKPIKGNYQLFAKENDAHIKPDGLSKADYGHNYLNL